MRSVGGGGGGPCLVLFVVCLCWLVVLPVDFCVWCFGFGGVLVFVFCFGGEFPAEFLVALSADDADVFECVLSAVGVGGDVVGLR